MLCVYSTFKTSCWLVRPVFFRFTINWPEITADVSRRHTVCSSKMTSVGPDSSCSKEIWFNQWNQNHNPDLGDTLSAWNLSALSPPVPQQTSGILRETRSGGVARESAVSSGYCSVLFKQICYTFLVTVTASPFTCCIVPYRPSPY